MALFKLPNQNNIPFADTDYYKWLIKQNLKDVHAVKTKTEYLESIGFIIGTDRLSEEDIRGLKYIEDEYYKVEVRGIPQGNR